MRLHLPGGWILLIDRMRAIYLMWWLNVLLCDPEGLGSCCNEFAAFTPSLETSLIFSMIVPASRLICAPEAVGTTLSKVLDQKIIPYMRWSALQT